MMILKELKCLRRWVFPPRVENEVEEEGSEREKIEGVLVVLVAHML